MRVRRVAKILLLLILLAAGAVALAVYLLAGAVPESYQPSDLTPAQREQAVTELANEYSRFNEQAVTGQTYTWTLSQDQVNRYLASMDEANAMRVGHEAGEVKRKLARAGIADPAVVFDNQAVTLMCRLREYDKIVAADLAFEFTPDGKLRLKLAGARIGRLPLPRDVVADKLARLKAVLADASNGSHPGQGAPAGQATGEFAEALRAVVMAIEGDPIDPEALLQASKRRVRFTDVTVDDGLLTLTVQPVTTTQPR